MASGNFDVGLIEDQCSSVYMTPMLPAMIASITKIATICGAQASRSDATARTDLKAENWPDEDYWERSRAPRAAGYCLGWWASWGCAAMGNGSPRDT
jgi:hypothetical protein